MGTTDVPPWLQILPDGEVPTWSELLDSARRALKRALYHGFATFSHKGVSFGAFSLVELQDHIRWLEDRIAADAAQDGERGFRPVEFGT